MQLLHAIITRHEPSETAEGVLHLAGPISPILVPAGQRADLARKGYDAAPLPIEPLFVTIILWGGKSGERCCITGAIRYPNGDTTRFDAAEGVWGNGSTKRYAIRLDFADDSPLIFWRSGVYRLKLLLNGNPLAELAIPIFWADEFPDGPDDVA